MKNENKSRLERFDARYAKNKADENAILQREIDSKRKMLDSLMNEIQNIEELAKKGNIKHEEAAAVITQEGMQTFATWFGNSVSTIFRDEAVPMFRNVLRQEMQDMMLGVMKGLVMGMMNTVVTEESFAEAAPATQEAAPEVQASQDEAEAPQRRAKTPTKDKTPKTRGRTYGSGKRDSELIANTLKEYAAPLRLKDIVTLTPEVNFGAMPTNKMYQAAKYDSRIQPLGQGMYMYDMT